MAIGYCSVKINLSALVADTEDPNEEPDRIPLTGDIKFEPTIAAGTLIQYDDDGELKLIAVTPVTVSLGNDGSILHRGIAHVNLPAPTQVETNVDGLQWKATFLNIKYGTDTISVNPITFNAAPGAEINLAAYISVGGTPTAILQSGPRGYSVVGAREQDGFLILTLESESGEIDSDPIPLPSGGGAGGAGLTAEEVLDTIGAALVSGAGVSVTVNDPANTITIASTAYVKPGTGIPSADLAAAVQTSLGKADTSVQPAGLTSALSGKSDIGHNHTSSQITDFTEAAQDAIAALLAGTSGVTLNYDDTANTLTITGSGAAGLDAESVRDAIGIALVGTGLISVAVNDAADTITISTTATANDTDANLKNRSNHTGTQTASTVSDFDEAARDAIGTALVGSGVITVTPNDPANTITVSSTATANDTDANLKNRSNHTGTQTSSTISDFTEAAQDAIAALLAGTSGVTLNYNDAANTLTITGPGAAGLDAEAVRDAIGIALVGTGLISIAVNDAADTITVSTTATANDTDANLKNRSNHTGTQPISSLSGTGTTGVDVLAAATKAAARAAIGVTVSATAPSSPAVNDIWIQIP